MESELLLKLDKKSLIIDLLLTYTEHSYEWVVEIGVTSHCKREVVGSNPTV